MAAPLLAEHFDPFIGVANLAGDFLGGEAKALAFRADGKTELFLAPLESVVDIGYP